MSAEVKNIGTGDVLIYGRKTFSRLRSSGTTAVKRPEVVKLVIKLKRSFVFLINLTLILL